MIQLRFLGKARLTDSSGQQIQMATRKIEQVLAYLWLRRDQPQPRERMAGVFWPDAPEEKARASLRNAIFEINKRLSISDVQPLILSARTTAQFNRNVPCCVDVEQFESKLKESEDQPHQQALQLLDEAVSLYQGDFLPESYDDWCLEERDYLQERYLSALKQLVALHKEQESFQQAIHYAKLLIAKNALQEETHRELMLLHYAVGDRSAALQAYQDLTKLLDAELGIEPLPETQALYKLILERASTTALEEKSKQWKDLVQKFPELGAPFIGRVEETGQILAAWEEARNGHGKAILVAGEAGSGKTRLAQEILNYVRSQGGLVLLGQCYESEGPLPYQPWMEILRELLAKASKTIQQQFQPFWLNEVSKLLPEITELFPDVKPRVSSLPLAQEKNNLFEAIAQMLLFVSEETPLTLHLDDLQWADQATLQLVNHMARRLKDGKILFLGMMRSEYLTEGHPLKDFVIGLLKDDFCEQISLPPLSKSEIANLVRGMLQSQEEMPEGFISKVERSSRGNAFFVVELVQSYLQSGAVSADDREGWHVSMDKLAGAVPPPKVEAVVEDRLRPISSRSREVLNLASTRSRAFQLDFLQSAMERSEDELITGLEELLRAGLLSEQKGFYQFKHDVIREVIYRNLLPERKRRLHHLAGQVLERLHGEKAVGYGIAMIGEIAEHYSQARVERKALDYFLQAGEQAWGKSFSKEEAIHFYQKSLELAQALDDDGMLAKIYGELGRIYATTDEHQKGIDFCLKALELCREPSERTGLHTTIVNACRLMRKYKEGLSCCDKGLAELDKARNPDQAARLLDRAGVIYLEMRDPENAIANLKESLQLLNTSTDMSLVCSVHVNMSNAYSLKSYADLALQHAKKGLAIAEKLGDLSMRVNSYFAMGHAYAVSDDPERAISWYSDTVKIHQQMGDEVSAGWVLQRLAQICMRLGKLIEANRFASESLQIWETMKNKNEFALTSGMLGAIKQALDLHPEADSCFIQALKFSGDIGLLHYSVSLCFAMLDRAEDAISWFKRGAPHMDARLFELAKSEPRFAFIRDDPRFQSVLDC